MQLAAIFLMGIVASVVFNRFEKRFQGTLVLSALFSGPDVSLLLCF
jgi:hypothetical protein